MTVQAKRNVCTDRPNGKRHLSPLEKQTQLGQLVDPQGGAALVAVTGKNGQSWRLALLVGDRPQTLCCPAEASKVLPTSRPHQMEHPFKTNGFRKNRQRDGTGLKGPVSLGDQGNRFANGARKQYLAHLRSIFQASVLSWFSSQSNFAAVVIPPLPVPG